MVYGVLCLIEHSAPSAGTRKRSMKITKNVTTRCYFFCSKCIKAFPTGINVWGFAPDPTYSAPNIP